MRTRTGAFRSTDPPRPIGDLRSSGVLWAINHYLFHPRGYALGLYVDDAGKVAGWRLYGDGSDPFEFDDDSQERAAFEAEVPVFDVHRQPRTRSDWAWLWAKSISWRLISTGLLFLIAWLVTGSWETGGIVAFIHMVLTIIIYVPHDLWWERFHERRAARRS